MTTHHSFSLFHKPLHPKKYGFISFKKKEKPAQLSSTQIFIPPQKQDLNHHHNHDNHHHHHHLHIKPEKLVLNTFDTLICIFIINPCIIGVWRGTWELMEFVYHSHFPKWESALLGILIHVVFVVLQNIFNDLIKNTDVSPLVKIVKTVLIRLYVYAFAVTCIMTWSSMWLILDDTLGVTKSPDNIVMKEGSGPLAFITFGSLFILVLLRGVYNTLSSPFFVCFDREDIIFTIPTRFKTQMSEKASLYILDCLFSVLVIGTLVVFVWRGCWALIDILLFPENVVWSAWGSLIVGYSVVAIAFLLQPFMKWLCDRITGVARLLAADLFLILSLIGTINVWRGIWNLLNIYLLPDNLEMSCWITHSVCLTILILLGCSNSLLVRGVYIDAEEPAGKCVIFPCYYLRLIFQEQKMKKMQKELSKTEMASVKPCENNHVIAISNANETLSINHKEGN